MRNAHWKENIKPKKKTIIVLRKAHCKEMLTRPKVVKKVKNNVSNGALGGYKADKMSKDSGVRSGANKVKKKVLYGRVGSSEKVFSCKIKFFWGAFSFFL